MPVLTVEQHAVVIHLHDQELSYVITNLVPGIVICRNGQPLREDYVGPSQASKMASLQYSSPRPEKVGNESVCENTRRQDFSFTEYNPKSTCKLR